MIPQGWTEKNCAFVPIIEKTDEFMCIDWIEDSDISYLDQIGQRYCTLDCNICLDDCDRDNKESLRKILYVYTQDDKNTGIRYFIVSWWEPIELDDIKSCLAFPAHPLNLIKFYKENLMTFPDAT